MNKVTSQTQGQTKANPVQASGILRRKCACGNKTIAGGECEACGTKRMNLQRRAVDNRSEHAEVPPIVHEVLRSPGQPLDPATRAFMEPRFGHDFSRMRVHADSPEPLQANPPPQIRVLHQMLTEGEETEKYTGEGVLMTLAGSGTCVNGGAASACDPNIGAYKILRNDNTCCTKNCSLNHEITHVSDITNWGCCRALSVAYNAPGADKNAAVKKYNDWLSSAVNITECHAYSNDVICANSLAIARDCADAGRDTDCCKDIADYKTTYAAFAKTACDAAPAAVPPCPAF